MPVMSERSLLEIIIVIIKRWTAIKTAVETDNFTSDYEKFN